MRGSELLSGPGTYRLTLRRRRMLRNLFVVSAAVHVLALAVVGGMIVMRNTAEQPPSFSPGPAIRRYDPRPLEWRVKLSKQQRSSSRPAPAPRLTAFKQLALALPAVPRRPPKQMNVFRPRPSLFAGGAFAAGAGDGNGVEGFSDSFSTLDFIGIHARGERMAILVDVSVSMVEEERGGVAGYTRVKQRMNSVIDAIQPTTLFTVIAFADAARAMSEDMLIASPDNKTRAKLFLRPFNTEGNWGLTEGNAGASPAGLKAHGGTTRLDLALTAACVQGADTILVLSDGMPRVRKAWSAERMAAFQQEQAAWYAEHAASLSAWDTAQASAPAQRVWIPPSPARPPARQSLREGQPLDRGSPARPGRWEVTRSGGGRGTRPAPPATPDPGFWTLADFVEHLALLYKYHYASQGRERPVVHCIGYQIENSGHEFLKGLAKAQNGQYRRVTRLAAR